MSHDPCRLETQNEWRVRRTDEVATNRPRLRQQGAAASQQRPNCGGAVDRINARLKLNDDGLSCEWVLWPQIWFGIRICCFRLLVAAATNARHLTISIEVRRSSAAFHFISLQFNPIRPGRPTSCSPLVHQPNRVGCCCVPMAVRVSQCLQLFYLCWDWWRTWSDDTAFRKQSNIINITYVWAWLLYRDLHRHCHRHHQWRYIAAINLRKRFHYSCSRAATRHVTKNINQPMWNLHELWEIYGISHNRATKSEWRLGLISAPHYSRSSYRSVNLCATQSNITRKQDKVET